MIQILIIWWNINCEYISTANIFETSYFRDIINFSILILIELSINIQFTCGTLGDSLMESIFHLLSTLLIIN